MNRLKILREARGLTQQEMADLLGEQRTTVTKWESDEAYPRASKLPQIADLLGCTIDELYGRTAKTG